MKHSSGLIIIILLFLAVSLTACGGSPASAKEITVAAGDPAAGQLLFKGTCAACHGPDGQGLPGLGKNLAASKFVAGQSDQALVEFITAGRRPDDPLNTTGILMPPKGGKADLTDQDLYNIIAYLRVIQK